jgi:hypothetical protein
MEHPTQMEALKQLAENFWNNTENWNSMEDFITNSDFDNCLDPKNQDLYLAAISTDNLELFLESFYDSMEGAGHVKNFRVCKDCYDFCTFEDYATIAEIYEYHYGEEIGEKIYRTIKEAFGKIVDDHGFLYGEVPELLVNFAIGQCEMCGSGMHGERFFMVFRNDQEKKNA